MTPRTPAFRITAPKNGNIYIADNNKKIAPPSAIVGIY